MSISRALGLPIWLTRFALRSKISQRSLFKHLIALRVRLSTAKLSWTQEFLGEVHGLDALESLLAKITLEKVNQYVARPAERQKQQLIASCYRPVVRRLRTRTRRSRPSASSVFESS